VFEKAAFGRFFAENWQQSPKIAVSNSYFKNIYPTTYFYQNLHKYIRPHIQVGRTQLSWSFISFRFEPSVLLSKEGVITIEVQTP
jgi:hypothetical protein